MPAVNPTITAHAMYTDKSDELVYKNFLLISSRPPMLQPNVKMADCCSSHFANRLSVFHKIRGVISHPCQALITLPVQSIRQAADVGANEPATMGPGYRGDRGRSARPRSVQRHPGRPFRA